MDYPPLITYMCPDFKCRVKPGCRATMMSFEDYDKDFVKGCVLCGRELEIQVEDFDEETIAALGIEIRKS